jgi:anthranilate synthase/aminodeoxychorismate synthase-like glutamine amidotransferase
VIAIIDNYDSFVFNLAQAFGALGEDVRVFRNDALTTADIAAMKPDALVLSPGPGRPEDAGVTMNAVQYLSDRVPTLGVCLGHQAIAAAFGGRVIRAGEARHGKSSEVEHDGADLFEGLPPKFAAGRYHSLVAERSSLPSCLRVNAWTDDGTIMGVRHESRPLFGVQFHPESVLTPEGVKLLRNFTSIARRSD